MGRGTRDAGRPSHRLGESTYNTESLVGENTSRSHVSRSSFGKLVYVRQVWQVPLWDRKVLRWPTCSQSTCVGASYPAVLPAIHEAFFEDETAWSLMALSVACPRMEKRHPFSLEEQVQGLASSLVRSLERNQSPLRSFPAGRGSAPSAFIDETCSPIIPDVLGCRKQECITSGLLRHAILYLVGPVFAWRETRV